MLAEALDKLTEILKRSVGPMELPGDRFARRVALNGSVLNYAVPAEPRDHEPDTLADVIALANRFYGEAVADPDVEYAPVVWYDSKAVVLVIDDQDQRQEKATLDLELSDVMCRLMALRAGKEASWFDQKQFIRLLRIELAGTLEPVVLLERVRKVSWEQSTAVQGNVQRDRESLGRSINQAATGAEPIPEEVTLQVPVYKTPGESARWPFRCTVDVDHAMGRFQLLPLPDEVERVIQAAVADIGKRLREGLDEGVACYGGKP